MGHFTLVTFLLDCPEIVHTVELLGSWDNFTKSYAMKRDTRRGAGHWNGCHSFTDIICDGDIQNLTPRRDGGLKMGGLYWYYYRLDGYLEFHDSCEPSTTSCPLLPGQRVNILEVPYESSSRRSSISSTSSDAHTFNPADKYVNPKPPPLPTPCSDSDGDVEIVEQMLGRDRRASFRQVRSVSTRSSKHDSRTSRCFRKLRPRTSASLPISVAPLAISAPPRSSHRRAFSEGFNDYERNGCFENRFIGTDGDFDWERESTNRDSALCIEPANLQVANQAAGDGSMLLSADEVLTNHSPYNGRKTLDPPVPASTSDSRPVSRRGMSGDAREDRFGLDNVLLELDRVDIDNPYERSPRLSSDSDAVIFGQNAQPHSQFPLWQDSPIDFQYLVSEEGPIQSPSFSLHTASSSGIITPNRTSEHQGKEYFPPGAEYFREEFGNLRRASYSSDAIHLRSSRRDQDFESCAALEISGSQGSRDGGNTSFGIDFDDSFSCRGIFRHKDASQATITQLERVAATEQHRLEPLAHVVPSHSAETQNRMSQIDSLIDDFAYLRGAVS